MNRLPSNPLFYLITKGETTDENLSGKRREILDTVRLAVECEIPMVQLREKNISARSLFNLASEIAVMTRGSKTRLLINDRADIAAASGADGVHLTANSLPVNLVRANFPDLIIGASTHSPEELANANAGGADFAVFGPVFPSPGKGSPVGLLEFKRACGMFPAFPLIGLGGIDGSNFESILDAGAAGVAAIRWLNDATAIKNLVGRSQNG